MQIAQVESRRIQFGGFGLVVGEQKRLLDCAIRGTQRIVQLCGLLFRLGFGGFGGPAIPGVGQNTTPMATRVPLSEWDPSPATQKPERPQVDEAAQFRQLARQFGIPIDESTPRVVLRFPQNPNDMLLSGTLSGGQALANRAQVVDATLGKGHVVMFAIRPFWRWQTHGTYSLGFNAIMNWNDLDAGR